MSAGPVFLNGTMPGGKSTAEKMLNMQKIKEKRIIIHILGLKMVSKGFEWGDGKEKIVSILTKKKPIFC